MSSLAVWPAAIPFYTLRSGYSDLPAWRSDSFVPEDGEPIDTPIGTSNLSRLRVIIPMTGAQFDLFKHFLFRDLNKASNSFVAPHPRSRQQMKMTIVKQDGQPYRDTYKSEKRIEVSIELIARELA